MVPSESKPANEHLDSDFVSSPFSSGGGGVRFENQVQASFVAMMLVGGSPPVLVGESIQKIKLQGRYAGFHTDDLIIFTGSTIAGSGRSRLLAQIKHKVSFTRSDKLFKQVVKSAWKDWGNPQCFTREQDALALITGPLSATDIAEVRVLLEWARHSESATDFFQKVELGNFSSDEKRNKLVVLRETVTEANAGIAPEDHEFFSFLQHFHLLGYDLDIKAGVIHALLHSLIAPYATDQSHLVWSMLLEEVTACNQNSGTITVDTVAIPLRKIFSERKYFVAPPSLIPEPTPPIKVSELQYAAELTIANLLGQWDEVSDRAVVEALISVDYWTWIARLNELLLLTDSPIALRDRVWRIRDRKSIWLEISPRLTLATLEAFTTAVVAALQSSDELSADASHLELSNTRRCCSRVLRRGLAESMALLGTFASGLKHCSPTEAETMTIAVVRNLISNADWRKWRVLNDIMPLLAEAEPTVFLDELERRLGGSQDHFPMLFAQEAVSSIEITGTLWALETIAWNGELLMRAAVILADLAAIDPSGRWANRPFNSLVTILLPWYPQTLAPFPKQIATVRTVLREQPDIGWRLLLSLMPSASVMSSGTHRPTYREWIPKDWEPRVKTGEYGERVAEYARLAAEIACRDRHKLKDTLNFIRYMPVESLDQVIQNLNVANETMSNEDTFELWTGLSEFLEQYGDPHSEYTGLTKEVIESLEATQHKLAPTNPLKLHRWLFNGDPHQHMDPDGDCELQLADICAKQDSAVSEILNEGGIEAIRQFAEVVSSPSSVGFAVGRSGTTELDAEILPLWLNKDGKTLRECVWGFVQGRFANGKYDWVGSVGIEGWSRSEALHFLQCLPFQKETWNRVSLILKSEPDEYWSTVTVSPHNLGDDYIFAVDQFLKSDRPAAALSCLRSAVRAKKEIPIDRVCQALLQVRREESGGELNARTITELIKYLQQHPGTPRQVMCDIEWKFLPILDDHHRASAVTLHKELTVNPAKFCEITRICFRSRNAVQPFSEATDEEKAFASSAYYLLSRWKQLPGTEPDGSFSSFKLNDWLHRVFSECDASGHGEVARFRIGELFIHAPADPDGLWIHKTVAEALNARDNESMREGYRSGWFNSRGVYPVDPQGRPEKDLAAGYRSNAEAVEYVGYQRLAKTLRDLADMYEREAQRIVERHKSDGTPDLPEFGGS